MFPHHPSPKLETCRPQHGFSLLELVIVVCIVAVLATLAADRLMDLRMKAERVSMDTLLGNLRSALGIKVAKEIALGRQARIAELAGSNPIDQVAEVPESYRGAFYGLEPGLIDGGQWYFDSRDRTLVYRVRFEELFRTALARPLRARFKVALVYEDVNGNQKFDAGIDHPSGVRLEAVEPYEWLDRPG